MCVFLKEFPLNDLSLAVFLEENDPSLSAGFPLNDFFVGFPQAGTKIVKWSRFFKGRILFL